MKEFPGVPDALPNTWLFADPSARFCNSGMIISRDEQASTATGACIAPILWYLAGNTRITMLNGSSSPPIPGRLPGARLALALLLAINFFNYVDRQVLAAVETKIEGSFFPESEYPRDS